MGERERELWAGAMKPDANLHWQIILMDRQPRSGSAWREHRHTRPRFWCAVVCTKRERLHVRTPKKSSTIQSCMVTVKKNKTKNKIERNNFDGVYTPSSNDDEFQKTLEAFYFSLFFFFFFFFPCRGSTLFFFPFWVRCLVHPVFLIKGFAALPFASPIRTYN